MVTYTHNIVKMENNNSSVVIASRRTLLHEVNEYITCFLCRGYYIDATTIVECLHSFCRSCIIKHLQVKSYCPVCEMLINTAKPNIKLDKALQDIVYKLVPGLFQSEMSRRQQFYASRPDQAATATAEQRGEDTERLIFSPEDVISFSLEYSDNTDTESTSSKSSECNDTLPIIKRRYMQCPAVVNISHLKKIIGMKFDIDSSLYVIELLYKRVPLPDYYTLMDIAYIYNWKRNEPMHFFYQIIDYEVAMNRSFEMNNKKHIEEIKSIADVKTDLGATEKECDSNSDLNIDCSVPFDINIACKEENKQIELQTKVSSEDNEVEKSQFLNSFELTAKSSSLQQLTPVKVKVDDVAEDKIVKTLEDNTKSDDNQGKKQFKLPNKPECNKGDRIDNKTESGDSKVNLSLNSPSLKSEEKKVFDNICKTPGQIPPVNAVTTTLSDCTKETKQKQQNLSTQHQAIETAGLKRTNLSMHNVSSPKRKSANDPGLSSSPPGNRHKTSPSKVLVPHCETSTPVKKASHIKPHTFSYSPKKEVINKSPSNITRNSNTNDKTKSMSQVKASLVTNTSKASAPAGTSLKSLFDSCKLNIPPSLSITLTDQKYLRGLAETSVTDPQTGAITPPAIHKMPASPVHNYIEILKLPESESKVKQNKPESDISDNKTTSTPKIDTTALLNNASKSSESSIKGPIPNLKPIGDIKFAKQTANYSSPRTFQQSFEQQLQSDNKPKTKTPVPQLVPATSKSFISNKLNSNAKPNITTPGTALDLSTAHGSSSHLGLQQNKALKTMQSITNLANQQNKSSKAPSLTNHLTSSQTRPHTHSSINQIKLDKIHSSSSSTHLPSHRQESFKSNLVKPASPAKSGVGSVNYQNMHSPQPPPPRTHTRSPSSSPKLIIAEDKQTSEASTSRGEHQKSTSSSSRTILKTPSLTKSTPTRQPITPSIRPTLVTGPPNFFTQQQLLSAHAAMLQNEWLKAHSRQMDLLASMAQAHKDFNKDK